MDKVNIINEETETNSDDVKVIHHSHHSSHSSHSNHHRHHSSRKHKNKAYNKKKEEISRFFKSNKKYLSYSGICLLVVLCLTFMGLYIDQRITISHGEDSDKVISSITNTESKLQISVPFYADSVTLSNPAVEEYIKPETKVAIKDIFDKYKTLGIRLDIGMPIELSYKIDGIPSGVTVKKSRFLVSENENLKNPMIFNINGNKNKVSVYNLKTSTKYFYSIILTFSNDTTSTINGSFTTANGPRLMNVDGVYNMRDIGGWKTSDGKMIKQGLLYRGRELDGAVESEYTITPDGVSTMLTSLGIRSDFDLRSKSENKLENETLGAGVKHIYFATPMYSSIFDSKEKSETIRKVFSELSNKNNYPVYLHCTYGQDRTGTVCYLLEALLGLDEQSLMKEYQLSGLCYGDVESNSMSEFIGRLKSYKGENINEKVENYLISIGVTQQEIARIKSIFLEK